MLTTPASIQPLVGTALSNRATLRVPSFEPQAECCVAEWAARKHMSEDAKWGCWNESEDYWTWRIHEHTLDMATITNTGPAVFRYSDNTRK